VNFLVEPKKGTKWPKELPRFSSRPDAIAVCKELCTLQYILRGEKVAKGELEVSSSLISICTTLLFAVLHIMLYSINVAAFFRVAEETIFYVSHLVLLAA
jgi:hypothetical protein